MEHFEMLELLFKVFLHGRFMKLINMVFAFKHDFFIKFNSTAWIFRQRSWLCNVCRILESNKSHYYIANPVLGKSLCSGWFFLGQDFVVRTVSKETVQSVYFCFGAKPANSKFATKTAKKKVWKLSFFTLKLPAEARKIEISPKFQRWMKKTNIFLSASQRKCILLSGTECHIINYLLTELTRP